MELIMIIPINNGHNITPIYIPTSTSFYSTIEQNSNTPSQESEPTLFTWIILCIVIIFIITYVIVIIKLIKDLSKEL